MNFYTKTVSSIILINLILMVKSESNSRTKRFPATFPKDAGVGFLAAVAIPLESNSHVFLSYLFESHFATYAAGDLKTSIDNRLPGILPPVHQKGRLIEGKHKNVNSSDSSLDSDEDTNQEAQQSLLSRKNIYLMLEEKLKKSGYNGRSCLLRTICEVAETPIGESNGVLGDIVHVIFTPSSSKEEPLNPDFREAEKLGKSQDCSKYHKKCKTSVLDLISTVLIEHF